MQSVSKLPSRGKCLDICLCFSLKSCSKTDSVRQSQYKQSSFYLFFYFMQFFSDQKRFGVVLKANRSCRSQEIWVTARGEK